MTREMRRRAHRLKDLPHILPAGVFNGTQRWCAQVAWEPSLAWPLKILAAA